jgi:asparagine synthase (glutamine-hydrolysing)
MRAARHDPGWAVVSPAWAQQFRLSYFGGAWNGTAEWAEIGRVLGLALLDPTRDRRLVEFCWRLPDELFWAHGKRRGLITQTLRSALPSEVIENQRRGLQSADLLRRLQASPDELRDEAYRVSRHPLVKEWIDVRRLVASAESIAQGGEHGLHELLTLLRALAAAMFVLDCSY